MTMYEAKKEIPVEYSCQSVWLPHGVLGISNSQILEIPANTFGPFAASYWLATRAKARSCAYSWKK